MWESNSEDLRVMFHLNEPDSNNLQFHWGKKLGSGGATVDFQFYESFTFDGTEYSLYDSVYLSSRDKNEPDIGKIVNIWEKPNGKKQVKILWFFRPNEIARYLGDISPLKDEIFLAYGEGVGAYNVNPLEAIQGKCCVICISKDERNAQPPREVLQAADYIFFRTFNVESLTISETLEDKILGIEVKYLLNQDDDWKSYSVPKIEANQIGRIDKTIAIHISGLAKSETPRSLKSEVMGSKVEEIPTSISKNVANLGKHFDDCKHLSEEKNMCNFKKDIDNSSSQVEENRKYSKRKAHSSRLDGMPSKLMRLENAAVRPTGNQWRKNDTGTRKPRIDCEDDDSGQGPHWLQDFSEKSKPSEKKIPVTVSVEAERKANKQITEVTRKPEPDRSKWFKSTSWEERLEKADGQGTLVYIENLDPGCTSEEIQDIIYCLIKENCSARVIQRGTFQNPHYGQAYIIFKKAEAADQAVDQICRSMMYPDGRPLIASKGLFKIPQKKPKFTGHLTIDKLNLQLRKEWKEAVATSHCSQPNTIEYEMAVAWRQNQEISAHALNELHKRHYAARKEVLQELKAR